MRKKYLGLLAAAALSLSLGSCTLPGEKAQDDDFKVDDSYAQVDLPSDDVVNYEWELKPSVTAENIIVFDGSQLDPDMSGKSEMYKDYSVISRSGSYGLINYKGEITVDPTYKNYYICPCGQIVLYNVTDEKNDVREYCTIDSNGMVTDAPEIHESSKIEYYYDEDSSKVFYAKESEGWKVNEYTDKKTVVAEKVFVSQKDGGYEVVDDGEDKRYGLVTKDKVVLDFEYEDYYAPAYKGAGITSIALKKDGKWGYVNSKGKTILDFGCDEVFSAYNGELSDNADTNHPYLYSEDILPVSQKYSFGYYNLDGGCLVRPGEFEQARPVHRGKAWVCQGGKWGVVRFTDEEEYEEPGITISQTKGSQSFGSLTQASSKAQSSTTYKSTTAKKTTAAPVVTDAPEPIVTPEPVDTPDPVVTPEPIVTDPPSVDPEPIVTDPPVEPVE